VTPTRSPSRTRFARRLPEFAPAARGSGYDHGIGCLRAAASYTRAIRMTCAGCSVTSGRFWCCRPEPRQSRAGTLGAGHGAAYFQTEEDGDPERE
jgi:hypothetical protein